MATDKDYIDVKIDGVRSDLRADVAELRADVRSLDAKFNSLISTFDAKFAAVDAKLGALPNKWTFFTSIAAGVVATVGLVFSILSYAGDGASAAAEQQKQISETQALSAKNAEQISNLNGKLDRVLTALEKQPTASPQQ